MLSFSFEPTDSISTLRILSAAWLLFSVYGCERVSAPRSDLESHEDMQFVAGASYRMGSDLDELEGIATRTGLRTSEPLMPEVPGHDVTVSDFFIDTLDVSNRRFSEFVEAVPAWRKERADKSLHNGRYLEHWSENGPPERLLDHPVTFVTWQAAVAYCAWRGKRLPTEVEYEWAAQDGVSAIEYPWGNSPPDNDLVNWSGNGIRGTVPVGSYPPNARGLHDMSGNVWHFTADPWLGSYAEMLAGATKGQETASNPQARKVVRGGSWGANAANLRVKYRDSHRAFDAREMVGFRCAKSADAMLD